MRSTIKNTQQEKAKFIIEQLHLRQTEGIRYDGDPRNQVYEALLEKVIRPIERSLGGSFREVAMPAVQTVRLPSHIPETAAAQVQEYDLGERARLQLWETANNQGFTLEVRTGENNGEQLTGTLDSRGSPDCMNWVRTQCADGHYHSIVKIDWSSMDVAPYRITEAAYDGGKLRMSRSMLGGDQGEKPNAVFTVVEPTTTSERFKVARYAQGQGGLEYPDSGTEYPERNINIAPIHTIGISEKCPGENTGYTLDCCEEETLLQGWKYMQEGFIDHAWQAFTYAPVDAQGRTLCTKLRATMGSYGPNWTKDKAQIRLSLKGEQLSARLHGGMEFELPREINGAEYQQALVQSVVRG